MGTLDIPIPLRAYPSPPRLVSQTAEPTFPATNPPTTIPQALQWNYRLELARPTVAQDDLHLSILGNGATVDRTVGSEQADALFDALATFQDFQARYLTNATAVILDPKTTSAPPWLNSIVLLVQDVANAWQPETEEPASMDALQSAAAVPAPFTWDFILQVRDESTPNVLTLTWTDTGTPVWPTINQVNGVVSGSNPNECTYTLQPPEPPVDVLTLVWSGLSVITIQSLSAAAWIERNETLIAGQATNPDFVYGTQTVTFHDPLVPLLQVATKLPIPNTTSLTDAVDQLVAGIMQPLLPESQVGWSLEAGYTFVLVSGQPSGQPLQTRLPVFLVKTALTTAASAPNPPPETMQQFQSELIAALKNWHTNFHPSDTNASLLFEVTLFTSNGQQPLARLLDIEAPISGVSWWAS